MSVFDHGLAELSARTFAAVLVLVDEAFADATAEGGAMFDRAASRVYGNVRVAVQLTVSEDGAYPQVEQHPTATP